MPVPSDLLTDRSAAAIRPVGLLVLSTTVVFIVGTLLIDGRFVGNGIGWLFPAATAALGLLSIRSYIIFLRTADELLRKIHIEALALGFGAAAVFMIAYRLCERLGAPKLDSNDPLIVMVSFTCIGLFLGVRRYSGGDDSE